MATKRARKSIQEPAKLASSLIAALKFISVAQKKAGTVQQQYCMIAGHWALASNGIITAACKIEEDLNACPHTAQLTEALLKCGQELNITQLSVNVLSIKSDKFKALIPCINPIELQVNAPDNLIAPLDNRIKEGFEAITPVSTDGAQLAHYAGVLLQAGSMAATNGAVLLEFWHGLDLPPNLLIPKAAAVAIAKCEKNLTGFGYSSSSATFYFEDESFIKTQLFNERFPHYAALFPDTPNAWPLPEGFFTAVKAIETFSLNGIVYFDKTGVSSREQESEASTYQIEGLPEDMAFNSKYLIMCEAAFKNVQFDKPGKRVIFFSDKMRGAIATVNIDKEPAKYNATASTSYEHDIPF